MKKIQLHCLSEQCKWFGAYEELEGHYQVCEHALISCIHKQCNIQLPRSLLGEHLKNDFEYRNVKCEYCGKDVPYASLKDHKENVCENALITCKYCNQMIPRKDIEHHESTICDEVPTDCEFQAIGCSRDKTLKRKEIQQHMKDNLIDHVFALLRYVKAFLTLLSNYVLRPEFTNAVQDLGDRITAVRSNLSEKFFMLVGKLTGLERKIESLERRIESLENRGEQNRIASLESQVTTISAIIQWMWERLDERGDLPEELHDARAL
ncbi:TNF receptor-associated factor 5-like [Xenia sp. Carnegie-2017]|uniref:TNF receptor-associated factor 5-like n=1 Tax=Xenia sp. Carnegie-2017 TaxID=2897299 RepID=UPI001F04134F|nr:TNF receptor-associated factor 5-like [Xenia sp. Carnegie-2017]